MTHEIKTLKFKYGFQDETPEWIYNWVAAQDWIEFARIEDAKLKATVPEHEFQLVFANVMAMKYDVHVFEFTDKTMFINIPDTPDTIAFILKNQ